MNSRIDIGLILKLAVWSLIVGAVLYMLRISPGDLYSWVFGQIGTAWSWISGSGLQYLLLGASIVVPLYLLSRLSARLRRRD